MKKINHLPMLWGMVLFLIGSGAVNAQAFPNPLLIPDTLRADTIKFSVDLEMHNFNPSGTDSLNTMIQTFGYNIVGDSGNSFLGPTLRWQRGTHQYTHVINNISDQQTTVHWHGAHIPAHTDGGPHQVIDADSTWKINFQIDEATASMWYHPHLHDFTFTQVEMGLSGLIIIEDPNDTLLPQLPHTYGVDDFPIIVQERQFIPSGSGLAIDTTGKNNSSPRISIVNGQVNPFLEVPQQMVRFRVLDGSSREAYQIGIADVDTNIQQITLIASDAGYTPSPIPVDNFLTGPGIRNEFVFDFSQNAIGDTLFLWNFGKSIPGGFVKNGNDLKLMKLVVIAPTANPITSIPQTFPPQETWDPADADTTRTKQFLGMGGPNPVPFSIDGNQYELDVVNDIVNLGATEIWRIENRTNVAHPFHIHDIFFQVISVEDTNGNALAMPVDYMGPQDNIMVKKGEVATFITQFTDFGTARGPNDFDSTYMYHCHILTHEDGYYAVQAGQSRDHVGMMQQFLVWDGTFVGTEDAPNLSDRAIFYPNPANTEINIKGESKKASEFCMYDLQGRLVLRQEFAPFNGKKTFKIGDLTQGMYLVEWRSGGEVANKKVVIRR